MLKKLQICILNTNKVNSIQNCSRIINMLANKEQSHKGVEIGLTTDALENHKYTAEEKDDILNIINNSKLNDLLSFEITKTRAKKLMDWRKRNGFLKDLNDILFVEGFSRKLADKFYQSVITGPKNIDNEKVAKARKVPFVTPKIDEVQRHNIKACVSVKIGVNSITWARLQLPEQDSNALSVLTHWQHHEVSDKKLHLAELIQRCLYINSYIPSASCYIFENPQMAHSGGNTGKGQYSISVQRSQILAMMGLAVGFRNPLLQNSCEKPITPSPNIFYMRRYLTARLFNHLVGNERVSSQQTILDMMNNSSSTENNIFSSRGNVEFPADLKEMFSDASGCNRDFLSQALLLNIAFVRLILIEDQHSINKVTSRNLTNK